MLRKGLVAIILVLLITVSFSGCFSSEKKKDTKVTDSGFEGVSFAEVIPQRAAMLVQHDSQSYIDDYAYLAGVPASVYYDESSDKLISYPLLFYEDPNQGSGEDLILNAGQGVDYFMEDWMTYSDEELDYLQLVNIADESTVTQKWSAKETKTINSNDYARVAAEIAKNNWAYSDSAVIAVAEPDYERPVIDYESELTGSLPGKGVMTGSFQGKAKPAPLSPIFHDFHIDEGYKYIIADMNWGNPLNPVAEVTARGKDPDLQLYDWELGPNGAEVACSANWNVLSGAREHIGSYIYDDNADWSAAVTYMPTKPVLDVSMNTDITGPLAQDQISKSTIDRGNTRALGNDAPSGGETDYTITYTLYPGIEIPLEEQTPFMCRNAKFELTWEDSSMDLGLILRGPSGADIANAIQSSGSNTQTIELPELGEGQYAVTVVNLGDSASETGFTIKYSWTQTMDKKEGYGLMSATLGAVFASLNNAPLLYSGLKSVPSATFDALNTLGVKNVYVIDIGDYGSSDLQSKLKSSRSSFQQKLTIEEIIHCTDMYSRISELSERNGIYQNDVIFTTINPWTTWYVTERVEGEEQPKSMFIGPAAYMAAHHGGPVIIVDMYSKLSCAQAWHNIFWRDAYPGRLPPSVGCMMLTGMAVYEQLKAFDLDRPGKETLITVADQFDIGTAWDRMLVGAALAGRIQGSPVDTAYWIARSVMYPAIIYANPAVNPEIDTHNGMRITGSESVRLGNGILRITKPEQEIQAEFNVLQSWVSYQHRFNELASKYWGCDYVTATGITPFRTPTNDEGVQDLYGVWPDLTDTEIVPFYLDQLGYTSVFTTNFDKTMENLNRGTIMWLEVMHGGNSGGGVVGFWKEGQLEENPWRGYEENAMTLRGSTADPDVVSMNRNIGLDLQPGFSPKTQLEIIPETHDGVIIALAQQEQTNYVVGVDFDNAMENIHSMGFNGGSCLIANTYLHTSLVRHGSVFQVIDPWLTSWYSAFAMETFVRDIILGYSVGEAYERGIAHVGVQYLTEGWWWDIFENLVYYGDPDLHVFVPNDPWDEPAPLTYEKSAVISGHAPFGANEHPNAIEDISGAEMGFYASMFIIILVIGVAYFRRQKKAKLASNKDSESSD
jgi:hypothetical protein